MSSLLLSGPGGDGGVRGGGGGGRGRGIGRGGRDNQLLGKTIQITIGRTIQRYNHTLHCMCTVVYYYVCMCSETLLI